MVELLKKKVKFELSDITSESLTTFLNPVSYIKARRFTSTYNQYSFILADGWLFVMALKAIGINTKRYSFDMTSLAPLVLSKAEEENKTIYFLGSESKKIICFISLIKKNYPALNIVGYRDGYFVSEEERNSTIKDIQKLTPNIVIAGLGVPLQEDFLLDLRKAGWNGCGYTCGGFIHQTSERLNYYPNWVNDFHLRMPYRFFKEPHFRKRLPDYIKFVFTFIYDYWKYKQKFSTQVYGKRD